MANPNPNAGPAGKNQRPCPALNGFISPADCGAQRGSKLNCPAGCPFYPFGTEAYDSWLRLEASWLMKSLKYLGAKLSRERMLKHFMEVDRKCSLMGYPQESAFAFTSHDLLFVQKTPQGKTLADEWEAEGWTGLNNDERVFTRYRRRSLVTVVEMQKVLNHQAMRCVDLFNPQAGPFVLYDRSMASGMARYTRILGWLTHYPHYSRFIFAGSILLPAIWEVWRESLNAAFDKARQAASGLEFQTFLNHSHYEVVQMINEVGAAYRERMLASLDLSHCVQTFALTGGHDAVETILKSKEDFLVDEAPERSEFARPLAFYAWLQKGESAAFSQIPKGKEGVDLQTTVDSVGTVGNVFLYADRLVIETFTRKKAAFARSMLEKYLGALARFEKESVSDMAKMMREREQAKRLIEEAQYNLNYEDRPPLAEEELDGDSAGEEQETPNSFEESLPPEERQRVMEQFHRQHYDKFLADTIPALDGLTPRAAAKDPAMRPRLVELMKSHINGVDQQSREKGIRLSLDWVLDELGLSELK